MKNTMPHRKIDANQLSTKPLVAPQVPCFEQLHNLWHMLCHSGKRPALDMHTLGSRYGRQVLRAAHAALGSQHSLPKQPVELEHGGLLSIQRNRVPVDPLQFSRNSTRVDIEYANTPKSEPFQVIFHTSDFRPRHCQPIVHSSITLPETPLTKSTELLLGNTFAHPTPSPEVRLLIQHLLDTLWKDVDRYRIDQNERCMNAFS